MFNFRQTIKGLKESKSEVKTTIKLSNKEIVYKLREIVGFVSQEMTDTKFTVSIGRF